MISTETEEIIYKHAERRAFNAMMREHRKSTIPVDFAHLNRVYESEFDSVCTAIEKTI